MGWEVAAVVGSAARSSGNMEPENSEVVLLVLGVLCLGSGAIQMV